MSRNILIITVTILILVTNHIISGSKACKYWCKTNDNLFYCCPSGTPPHQYNNNNSNKWQHKSWSMQLSTPFKFWIGLLLGGTNNLQWNLIPHLSLSNNNNNKYGNSTGDGNRMEYHAWDKMKYHDKKCPPIRSACPRHYEWSRAPQSCEYDGDCRDDSSEKCCYDVCLEFKVCKPSE